MILLIAAFKFEFYLLGHAIVYFNLKIQPEQKSIN